jgi:hypothetical protein
LPAVGHQYRVPREQSAIHTHNFGRSTLHNIQTVCVETWEAKQLRHTLQKHHNHGQRDAADPFLNTPTVDKHARWNDATQEPQTAAKAVFCFTVTPYANVLLDDMVCVSPTEEGAEEVATAGSDVE